MEYMFVGHPHGAMMVPWYDGADWDLNPHFVGQVKKIAGANFDKRPIVLICRSGNRTIEAGEALERAGFKNVFNVLHGSRASSTRTTIATLATAGASTAFRGSSTEGSLSPGASKDPGAGEGRGEVRLPPESLAWLVWGLGACLYLIAFYQRVAPAVITRELSREFDLSAASLGNLSAFYFYGYTAVQIRPACSPTDGVHAKCFRSAPR
jgi:hypothetical protein